MTQVGSAEILLELKGLHQTVKGLAQAESAVVKTGKAAGPASKGLSGLGSTMGQLTSAAGSLGIALGAVEFIRFAQDAMQADLAAEQFSTTLQALRGSAAGAHAAMTTVQDAVAGTMDEAEAMAIAGKAIALGWGDTNEELERFTYTAATLGKAFRGMSADESVQLFNQMLNNRSIKLLDDFGISVGEINRRLAEMGETGAEAWQQVALEVAMEKAEELGDIWESNATVMDAVKAGLRDLQGEFGQLINAGIMPLIRAMREQEQAAEETLDGMLDGAGAVESLTDAWADLPVKVKNAALAMRVEQIVLEEGVPKFLARIRAQQELNRDMPGFIANLVESERALDAEAQMLEAAARAGEYYAQERASFKDILLGVASAEEEHADAVYETVRAYKEGEMAWQSAEAKLRLLGATEEEVAEALGTYNEELERNAELERKAREEAFRRQKDLAGLAEELAGAYTYLGQTYTRIIGQDEQALELTEQLTKQRERLVAQQYELGVAREAGTMSAEDLAEAEEKLGEQLANTDAMLATAQSRVGGVAESYRITQLSAEDLKKAGEGLLTLWGMSTREIELQGQAYDNLRLKYGLVTQEQLRMEAGLDAIVAAMDRGILNTTRISEIYDQWITGAIPTTQELNRTIEEQERRQEGVIDKLDRTGFAAGQAAEESEGAAGRMQESFNETERSAATIDTRLLMIETKLNRLTSTPWRINLSVNGSIPDAPGAGAATGGDRPYAQQTGTQFWRGGMMLVGEGDSRGELVMAPRGSQVFSANETEAMLGGSQSAPVHITIPVMLNGREVGMMAVDGVIEAFRQRGIKVELDG